MGTKPNVDLNLLPALAALVDSRGVSAAARRLGLSQPAMSHALARLRTALGDPVLVRGANGMVPTPRALALVEPVRRVLGDLGAVLAPAHAFDPARWRGVLRLALDDAPAFVLVPRLIERLSAAAPGVDLAVTTWSARGTPEALAAGAVDLAVSCGRVEGAALRRSHLVDDRTVALVRRGHPRLGRRATPRQLAAESFVAVAAAGAGAEAAGGAGAADAEALRDDATRRLGAEPRIAATVPGLAAAVHLVSRTDLVLLTSERAARAACAALAVSAVLPTVRLGSADWWLCWHGRSHGEPWLRWLQGQVASVSRLRDRPRSA